MRKPWNALVAAIVTIVLAACGPTGYDSCAEAREANATPLHAGDAGWNPELDRDGDGVACE